MLRRKSFPLLQQVNWRHGGKNGEPSKEKDFGEFSGDPGCRESCSHSYLWAGYSCV